MGYFAAKDGSDLNANAGSEFSANQQDDLIVDTKFTQDWGSEFVYFRGSDARAISNIESSSKALLELDWHGNDETYFEITLRGSSAALTEIRTVCRSL